MRLANKTDKGILRSSESLGLDHSYIYFDYVRVAVAGISAIRITVSCIGRLLMILISTGIEETL